MTKTTNSGTQVLVRAFGEHPMRDLEQNIVITQMSIPNKEHLQPDDVMIEVKSAALSWVDLLMSCGLYQHKARLPYTPGLEYSGVIVWTGKNVPATEWRVGQKVLVDCFSVGPRSSGAYQKYGGFASYAVVPHHHLRPIPVGLSFDQACNLYGNYETAYHCLISCGRLQAGETVLIHGASGATGLAAVHIAKAVGAKVIATGRSSEKLAIVKQQGADHIITIERDENGETRPFAAKVKQLTAGRGVEVVYDGVGGDISIQSLRAMTFRGRFLIVGWASTPFVAKDKPNQLPTNLIMMKGLQVLGCPAVISAQKDPSIRLERHNALQKWLTAGAFQPYISRTYPLREVHQAMRDKWNGKIIGGCALRL